MLTVVLAVAGLGALWGAGHLLTVVARRRRMAAVRAVAAEPCRPGRWHA